MYELPFGRGKRYVSDGIWAMILGNWQTSGIMSVQTGTPISITAACRLPGVSGLGCYADRLKDPNLAGGAQTMDKWFDTKAFANPARTPSATARERRPNLRNPGAFSFDYRDEPVAADPRTACACSSARSSTTC